MTYFDKDKWVHQDGAPFIEVKTLRHDQYCAGLGMSQFDDDHYFVYVESKFDELYLFNFFDDIPEIQKLKMIIKFLVTGFGWKTTNEWQYKASRN